MRNPITDDRLQRFAGAAIYDDTEGQELKEAMTVILTVGPLLIADPDVPAKLRPKIVELVEATRELAELVAPELLGPKN